MPTFVRTDNGFVNLAHVVRVLQSDNGWSIQLPAGSENAGPTTEHLVSGELYSPADVLRFIAKDEAESDSGD